MENTEERKLTVNEYVRREIDFLARERMNAITRTGGDPNALITDKMLIALQMIHIGVDRENVEALMLAGQAAEKALKLWEKGVLL